MQIKIKNYDYEPIGKRLKEVRKKRGYTQEYIADKLNVSCQHISDIERGLNGMSVPALMMVCKILDIDADYILFGTVTKAENNPINRIISKMTPQQILCAEEILSAYARSCGIV